MELLTQTLEQWCQERMELGRCLAQCASAVVSGASAVGEGEHKMLAHMLANGAAAAQGTGADPCSHVFISGDADLFLLSLVQGLSKRVAVVFVQNMLTFNSKIWNVLPFLLAISIGSGGLFWR